MLPRLYDAVVDINAYNNNGYGFFDTCSKCEVTEVRNGEYNLTMEIASSDVLADVVMVGMFIKTKANQYDSLQLFEINEIIQSANGTITINANHIKFLGLQNVLENGIETVGKWSAMTPKQIVDYLLDDTLNDSNIFTFDSDISESKEIESTNFQTMKLGEILAGTDGSVLDLFGGEFHYDNFKIELLENRGADRGVKILFGKNMSDYNQTILNDTAYTHYIGYAILTDTNGNKVSVSGPATITVKDVEKYFPKIKLYDFTEKVLEVLGQDYRYDVSSNASANELEEIQSWLGYFSNEKIIFGGHPSSSVNIKITYDPELDKLQDIRLCDTVTVCFGRGKSAIKSKITKVIYDSILERYTLIEVGESNISLYDFLTKTRR